ncbi:MAG TPA: inositol 2-dehydrogenase [Acidobacteriota bacterium]|nr:inositol 2-dehydrogenase [Acidobacteriota bacterium]
MLNGNVRFGVVGVGRIGKVHIENLENRIPDASVIALSDTFPDELATMEARYDIPDSFLDYRHVLELADVDAVAICTPTDTHYRMILDAAAAGKHVFCERPIDLSLDGIREIANVVKKNGIKLMPGFNRRFDPNFQKVREVIQSGKVGAPHVLRITSRDPSPPPEDHSRSSGGMFQDMTIHDFDMARYLVGSEVTEVYARANVLVDPAFEKSGDWDTSVAILSFESGAMGTIDNSRKAVYGYDQRAEVFGSEGMVAVSNNLPDNHVYFDRMGTHSSPPLSFFLERYAESYLREMQAFVNAIRGNKPVPVGVTDELIAVEVGLAAMKSVRENRPVRIAEIHESHMSSCEVC